MGHGSATPFLDWQSRLSAIQCLDLALLIDAENDCLLRRIQVQTHHVGHLLQKLRIARQLEGLRAMGLQLQTKPAGMTHWSCRTMAQSQGVSKSTVNNIWRAHQGRLHDGGDLIDFIAGLSSPARSYIPQTVQPLLGKALPP